MEDTCICDICISVKNPECVCYSCEENLDGHGTIDKDLICFYCNTTENCFHHEKIHDELIEKYKADPDFQLKELNNCLKRLPYKQKSTYKLQKYFDLIGIQIEGDIITTFDGRQFTIGLIELISN